MNNHYFGVDLNLFLFGNFPNTVDRQSEVDKGYEAKQGYDQKADVRNSYSLRFVNKVRRIPLYNCSDHV